MRRQPGTTIYHVLLAVGLLLAASPADATDSLRCTGGLAQTGDSALSVRHACGEPDFVDPWVGGPSLAYGVAPSMEAWTYNRGSAQLLRTLIFRNGELESIRSDGYGFTVQRRPGRCQPADIVPDISKYRLLELCGKPAQQTGYFVFTSRRQSGGRTVFLRRGSIPVYRERWIYNFGDSRLLREVTLENAKVVSVDTLERGFNE